MHHDLGVIHGPIMLFGGPYSNRQATEALLSAAKAIPAARLICTGDVVAYGGAPSETVDLVCQSGAEVVAGNCELQLAADAETCGCGFEAGTPCDLLSAGWYAHARARITDAHRDWMGTCPETVSFRHCGRRYGVIHGGVTDVARFLWPVSPDSEFEQEWQALEARIGAVDAVIAGHSGLPFVKELRPGRWINAGVIGLPPHDGKPKTRYAVLTNGDVRIHDLVYDTEAARAEMVAAGLTQGYHDSLLTGYWPSEEVLPAALRSFASASG
ncbi:MAG: metallophosphoesterase family protein [Pseudomonadota bacterium]